LIDLDLLGIWVARTLGIAFALEAWAVGTFGKEVLVRSLRVLEGVL
jgi:hypothetical protein